VRSMGRSKAIDLLRAVAVCLVCFGRHMTPCPRRTGSWLQGLVHAITAVLARGGWVGVDLFFVLSGYLVSGLLFREHQRFGSIAGSQFLFRRGFKIYPSFWLLIFLTALGVLKLHHRFPLQQTISELAFIQNYRSEFLWDHTWSLAVEEHFYLLLLVFLVCLTRWATPTRPFRVVPGAFVIIAVLCLGMRLLTQRGHAFDMRGELFASHLRMDSLFFGVLISYFYHYHPDAFSRLAARWRWPLALFGGLALLLAFVFKLDNTPFLYTYGLTLFYAGSGALLTAGIGASIPPNKTVRLAAYVGSHSYSIYLWHGVVAAQMIPRLQRAFGVYWNWPMYVVAYVSGSLLLGVAMALLVEF
jgi:peptidoglycan/LPS O-acetylase OafA/YrhL